MKSFRYLTIGTLLIALGCAPRVANVDSKGTSIVCLGDSITQGVGARRGEDYPSILAEKVSLPVINAGVGGNTTAEALARIDTDVFDHDPKMVIILLGGNDFLRKVPKAQTVAHMERIAERVRKKGAVVVIAVVKIGLLGDLYTKEFRRIARENGAVFIPDIMKDILTDPKLKSDQIHPNSAGYQIIADRIYNVIQEFL
jgi:lysophospholipase L1-like esterase